MNQGTIHLKEGRLDQAIADFTKAIELDLTHAEAYYRRGALYIDKGEYDKALPTLKSVLNCRRSRH